MADNHYDAVIIGTGAGGGTLAWKLAQTGKRILLLERGDYLPRERDNWDSEAVFVRGKYTTDEQWYDKHGNLFGPEQNYYIGGNTKFYGAALIRLRPEDFGEITHRDGLSPAWPMSYEDFEPWYLEAEKLYHVHGEAGADDTDGPRSGPFPYPAVKHAPRIQQLNDDLASAGLNPAPLPIGVLLDQNDDGSAKHTSACIRCDRVDGFACVVNGKADAQTICVDPALREHPNLELMTNAHVQRLETDSDGRRVSAVVVTRPDGTDEYVSGDVVVVACGAINSAALLLRSASGDHPNGLANSSDQVGRNYVRHNSQAVMAVAKDRNPTKFQKTMALNDWYHKGPDDDYPLGGVQMLGKADATQIRGSAPMGLGKVAPNMPFEEIASRSIDFWLSAEDLPRPENRVTIAEDGTIQLSVDEKNNAKSLDLLRKQLDKTLTKIGVHDGGLIHHPVYLHQTMPINATAHQAGTCRFGTDPESSVLDLNCRTHDVENLYVVDSSFFVSIGAVNPTLTIIANALRVGEHLGEVLG